MAEGYIAKTDTTSITSKLMAEMLLGRIYWDRDNPGKSPVMDELRPVLIQIRKALGMETMEELVKSSRPVLHAFVDACFDAVTGIEQESTGRAIKALPIPQRTAIEAVIARVTAKAEGHKMWHPTLWTLKKRISWICAVSLSGITAQEIRTGYNDLVHQIIDRLCDEWKVVVQ